MAKAASFDKSKELTLYARINEDGVSIVLTFMDGEDPYPINGKQWELPVKQTPGSKENVFKLTEGNGLTVQGTDNNQLKIDLDEENATQRPVTYFWKLFSVTENKSTLNGSFIFHDGRFDGVEQTDTVTVYENGSTIIINVGSGEISLSIFTDDNLTTLTPSPAYDCYELTAQTDSLTIANPSTDYEDFEVFIVRLNTAGAETLTFGNKYRAQGVALPTTTTAGKVMILSFMRDDLSDKYDVRFTEQV